MKTSFFQHSFWSNTGTLPAAKLTRSSPPQISWYKQPELLGTNMLRLSIQEKTVEDTINDS